MYFNKAIMPSMIRANNAKEVSQSTVIDKAL